MLSLSFVFQKRINFMVTRYALIFIILCSSHYTKTSSVDSIIENLQNSYVESVDFLFTDIFGSLRCITIPTLSIKGPLNNGLEFDGSSIPGYSSIYDSDMHLKPDLKTFSIRENKAHIFCDVYNSPEESYKGDPRCLLKEQITRARKLGYEFYVGPELEFFLIHGENKNKGDKLRYCDASNNSINDYQKHGLLSTLIYHNIDVEKLHHEVARNQWEISIHYSDALAIADQIILAKQIIKLYAGECGLDATFMPKPFFGISGSGMHVHFSLYDIKNNCNVFYDEHDPEHLSTIARHFIAGVLKYVPIMSAFCNSTINSYKRLVAGYEAPVYVCWASKNRSALIRVPQIAKNQKSAARAEIRSSDATSNPYTLFTIILSAGLQGIEDKEELSAPVEQNLYKLSTREIEQLGIKTLPASLQEALTYLQQNDFAYKTLGNQLVQEFLKLKQKEVEQFNCTITDWEWNHYF